MKYNFQEIINRRNTDSLKWDHMKKGCDRAIAAWVADMDFASPPEVLEAIKKPIHFKIMD